MATKIDVNITRPPWNKYLLVDTAPLYKAGHTQVANNSRVHFLDKRVAERLVAIAKAEHGRLVINSANRTPYMHTTNASGRTGSSHFTGEAVDLRTIVYDKEEYKPKCKALIDKDKRLASLIAKYATGKDRLLNPGARIYATRDPENPVNVIFDLKNGMSVKTLDHGSSVEFTHFERIGITPSKIRKENGEIIAKNYKVTSDGISGSQLVNTTIYKNASSKDGVTKAVPLKDIDERIYQVDDTGKIIDNTFTHVQFEDGNVGMNIDAYTKQATSLANKNKAFSPSSVRIEYTKNPSNVNVGHTSDKSHAFLAPTAYSGEKSYRYAKRSSYPILDDSRDVKPSDLGLKESLQDKRIHNQVGCMTPFGTLAKYQESEQPASIRLILDKLFENERDEAAKNAWAKWEAANVTYIDSFLMDRVSNQSREKYTISASLGDEYKVYFGTSTPEVMQISGYTLNNANQQWLYDFRIFYNEYLKGSKLAKNRIRAFLTFTDAIYEILLTSFSYSESGKTPGGVLISLEAIVLQWIPFGSYQSPLERHKNDKAKSPTAFSAAQVNLSDTSKEVVAYMSESTSLGGMMLPYGQQAAYKKLMDQILLKNSTEIASLPLVYKQHGKNIVVDVHESKDATSSGQVMEGVVKAANDKGYAHTPTTEVHNMQVDSISGTSDVEISKLPQDELNIVNSIMATVTANFLRGS